MKKVILIFCAALFCFATETKAKQDSVWTLEKCIGSEKLNLASSRSHSENKIGFFIA